MPDGSVVLVEMFGPRLTRVRPDGSTQHARRDPWRTERCRRRARRCDLRVQQRRLLHAGRAPRPPAPRSVQPVDLHRWAGPARRPARWCGHRPVHGVRWAPAALTERPRDGRPRWFLVHGPRDPRHARGEDERPHRHLLRPVRRLGDQRGRLPGRSAERHRPVARRDHALLGRDPLGQGVPSTDRRPRAARPGDAARRLGRAARTAGLAAPRLAGRRRRRMGQRGDADQRGRHVDLTGWSDRRVPPHGGPADDEPVLRRCRTCARRSSRCPEPVRLVATTWPRPGLRLAHQ